MTYLTKILL